VGIVVVYSMSKQLGNGLVARAAECGGCDAVGCIGQWLHGGYNWQVHCVHLVVWAAKY